LPLGTVLGWRAVYAVMATLAILLLPLTIGLDDYIVRRRQLDSTVMERPKGDVIWLALFAGAMGAGMSGFTAYFALSAVEQVPGIDAAAAGRAIAIASAIGIATRVLWARRAAGKRHLTQPGRELVVASVGAVAAGLAVVKAHDLPLMLWLAVVLCGLFIYGWTGPYHVILLLSGGPRVGAVSGKALTGFSAGLMIGPPAMGLMREASGSLITAWLAVIAAFAIAGVFGLGFWATQRRALERASP
jgi:hypothetical protein